MSEIMVSNNLIPLIAIDIALPVQAFRFEYTLVGKIELPFIREFILRLLKIGNMSTTQIAKFLGLNKKEISVAITQLANLNEIRIDNSGNVQLTTEALKYFESLSDNRPKINKLFEGTSTFRFDLLSFNLISANEESIVPFNAIRLSPKSEVISNSITHAKTAFLRNYIDIFKNQPNLSYDLNKVELYKLSDVRKSRDYYISFPIVFSMNPERNSIELHSDSKFFEIDEINENLNEVLLNSVHSSNIKEIASALDLLDEQLLLDCLDSEELNFSALTNLVAQQNSLSSERFYFLGSPTNSLTWNHLTKIIKSHSKKSSNKISCSWLAPSDRFWLINQHSFKVTSELVCSTTEVETKLYLPVAGAKDYHLANQWKKIIGKMKDKAIKVSEGFLGGSVELISIPGVVSMLCFYLKKQGESVTIPFGFITTNKSDIERLHLRFTSYLKSYDSNMEQRDYGPLLLDAE